MPRTGLKEGLGFEEVQAGSEAALPTQNAFFTGSVTATNFSGNNVYATTSVVTPTVSVTTLSGTNVYAKTAIHGDTLVADTTFSGTTTALGNAVVTGSVQAALGQLTTMSGTNIYAKTAIHGDTLRADTTFSGTTCALGNAVVTGSVQAVGRVLSPAGTGSPTTWGKLVQAGNTATGAGSVVWVVFGTAYGAAPNVVVQGYDGGTGWFAGSPVVAGSVRVYSETASQNFSWITVG